MHVSGVPLAELGSLQLRGEEYRRYQQTTSIFVPWFKGVFLALAVYFAGGINLSYADRIIAFGPNETKMEGSIAYTVLGKYKAQFRNFRGRIVLNEHTMEVVAVSLRIKANSISSNSSWCDRLAKSRRLLNALKYPEIIFRSEKITRNEKGLWVKGILEMHGIKRHLTFPFSAQMREDLKSKRKFLDLKGSWSINRKRFNIVWNRLLDKGGIIVGDNFTVDWGLISFFLTEITHETILFNYNCFDSLRLDADRDSISQGLYLY